MTGTERAYVAEIERIKRKLQTAHVINDRRRIGELQSALAKSERRVSELSQLKLFAADPRRTPAQREQAERRATSLSLSLAMAGGYWFCNDCERLIDEIDPDRRKCPHCGSARVQFQHGVDR